MSDKEWIHMLLFQSALEDLKFEELHILLSVLLLCQFSYLRHQHITCGFFKVNINGRESKFMAVGISSSIKLLI